MTRRCKRNSNRRPRYPTDHIIYLVGPYVDVSRKASFLNKIFVFKNIRNSWFHIAGSSA